jgi:uncharacterized membrane protein YeaQ/YmgE (transglycosylase-associated protein family)
MLGFLLLLIIAVASGGVVQALIGYRHGGCLISITLAFVGAVLGNWLARVLDLPSDVASVELGGQRFPVAWSILGATLLVAATNLALYRPPRDE